MSLGPSPPSGAGSRAVPPGTGHAPPGYKRFPVSGKNSLMVLDFANTGATTLNTGVIQIDGFTDLSVHASQTITNVAAGDAIVIKGINFTPAHGDASPAATS